MAFLVSALQLGKVGRATKVSLGRLGCTTLACELMAATVVNYFFVADFLFLLPPYILVCFAFRTGLCSMLLVGAAHFANSGPNVL
jgi:hypothetical protein